MGIREPGALTKAIEQLRIDVADSDPEIRTTHVDFDSLLVVLEAAREAARQELMVEWLEWSAQTGTDDPASVHSTATNILSGLDALDRPFEHSMPPKEVPVYVVCGSISHDGSLTCELEANHDGDHKQQTDLGTVRWIRACKAVPPEYDGISPLPYCDQATGHDGEHFDSGKGVSW